MLNTKTAYVATSTEIYESSCGRVGHRNRHAAVSDFEWKSHRTYGRILPARAISSPMRAPLDRLRLTRPTSERAHGMRCNLPNSAPMAVGWAAGWPCDVGSRARGAHLTVYGGRWPSTAGWRPLASCPASNLAWRRRQLICHNIGAISAVGVTPVVAAADAAATPYDGLRQWAALRLNAADTAAPQNDGPLEPTSSGRRVLPPLNISHVLEGETRRRGPFWIVFS